MIITSIWAFRPDFSSRPFSLLCLVGNANATVILRSEPYVCRRPVATAYYGFVWPRGLQFSWRPRQEIRSFTLRLATGECERWTDDQGTWGPQPRTRAGGLSRVSRKPSPSCPFPLPPLSARSGGLDLETQSLRHVEDITTTRCPPHSRYTAEGKRGKHPVVIELAPREGTRERTNYLQYTRQTCPVDSLGRLLDPGRQHLGGEGGGQEAVRLGSWPGEARVEGGM